MLAYKTVHWSIAFYIDIVILFFFSFHYFEALGLFSFYFILIILFIKNVCDLNDLSYLIGLMSRAMLA